MEEKIKPDKPVVEATTVWVLRTVKRPGEPESVSEEHDVIAVHRFVTQPAMVSFSYPLKKSYDYNSAGITIGVSLPCYREEIDAACEMVEDFVKKRTEARLPEVFQAAIELSKANLAKE